MIKNKTNQKKDKIVERLTGLPKHDLNRSLKEKIREKAHLILITNQNKEKTGDYIKKRVYTKIIEPVLLGCFGIALIFETIRTIFFIYQ